MLSALGLSRTSLVEAFSQKYFDGQLVRKLVQSFREQSQLAKYAKTAHTNGKVLATVYVQPFIIAKVAEFLVGILTAAAAHVTDAQYQQITGLKNAVVGAVKNTGEAYGNIGGGMKTALAGFWDGNVNSVGSAKFQAGWSKFFAGLSEIGLGYDKLNLQTPLDALLTVTLASADSFTTIFGLEAVGRLLTPDETKLLKSVFASSVEYSAIRIKEGYAGILNAGDDGGLKIINNQRPITIGNTIYMKDKVPVIPNHASTLVHETTHVWQHQNGGTDYMGEAVYAQMTVGYGYLDDVIKKNKSWAILNPEQQGQLIQDAYEAGFFTNGQWIKVDSQTKAVTSKPNLAKYMQNVLPQLRAGQGAT